MYFTDAVIASIAAAATSLEERLRGDVVTVSSHAGDARYSRWRQQVAGDDDERLSRRLRWSELDREHVRRALGDAALADGAPLPSWCDVLRDAGGEAVPLREQLVAGEDVDDRCLTAGAPVPFEHIIVAFVRVARYWLDAALSGVVVPVTDAALANLERALLREISRLCAETLHVEFSIRSAMSATSGRYRAFCIDMLGGDLVAHLERYPVLARLIATRVEYYIEANTEFLSRLAADWAQIRPMLGVTESERIVRIDADLSDSHRHGRTVRVLHSPRGTRLVYKPRSVASERLFRAVVERVSLDLPIDLRTPHVVCGDEYGWVEFIESTDCDGAEAVGRFYHRAGMLTALAYVLGASDLHHENVIANGEYPVLIDLEVLPGGPETTDGTPSIVNKRKAYWDTVLRTALLPARDQKGHGRAGYGGFVRDPVEATPVRSWFAVNTDWMTYRDVLPERTDRFGNVPYVGGNPVSIGLHAEHLIAGFVAMARALVRGREAFCRDERLMGELRALNTRVLVRNTASYGSLLERSLKPASLQSGVDRSIALDAIRRGALKNRARPQAWPILDAECAQLWNGDVPYFRAPATDLGIWTDDGRELAPHVDESRVDAVIGRLRRLDDREIERQVLIAHTALASYAVRHAGTSARAHAKSANVDAPLTRDAALAEARHIGEELRAMASDGDRGAVWCGYMPSSDGASLALQPVDDSLSHGRAGIGLFFAALHAVGVPGGFDAAARAALRPMCTPGTDPLNLVHGPNALGAATGAPGVMYALANAGRWLRDDRMLDAAAILAGGITRRLVERDESLDVHAGSAGAILGLLALHRTRPDACLVQAAVRCGEHLLDARVRDAMTGRAVWRTTKSGVHTGFAHGASGIAYALLRLEAATGRAEFGAAASEALDFERDLFLPGVANWLDQPTPAEYRDAASKELWCSWCHGAAGIGIARAGASSLVSSADVAEDLSAAVATTLAWPTESVDQLCCGNLGRVAFLSLAGETRRDPALAEQARTLAARVVHRAGEYGCYGAGVDPTFEPGLLQGVAGIGYELLRVTHTQALPPLLLFA